MPLEISERQLALGRFWRKFLRLTRGRVSVLKTLEVAANEEDDPDLREAIRGVLRAVEAGAQLSEAIGGYPAFFSAAVVELVRSAEKTGAWDEILQEISDGLLDGTFR